MAQAAPREEDRLVLLEGKVEDLTRSLAALQQRPAVSEERATATPAALPPPRLQRSPEAREPAGQTSEEGAALPASSDVARILGLTGRTLIVFGGAYLLRAVTAAGYLPD